ncbi:uncharacterized protein LOC142419077 [Mycteria americana]|uniref:uncharacterized protein LOC142419077 n=1 Tax=Mycteria americana TaxID=33587 RepID=UPI003F589EDC
MDAPTTAQAPSRSSLLQLLRSLFGLPRSTRGTQEPRAEGQELGEVGGGSSPGRLAGQQHPCWEPWEGAERESTEPLLGELGGLSLTGSPGSSASRSCLSLSTSDTEVAVAGGVADTPASSPAQQHAGSGVASKEGTAMPEAFSDKALETDGLLQGLSADGEDVTCSASPELMFSVDFDAEWEKEQLLKAEQGMVSRCCWSVMGDTCSWISLTCRSKVEQELPVHTRSSSEMRVRPGMLVISPGIGQTACSLTPREA